MNAEEAPQAVEGTKTEETPAQEKKPIAPETSGINEDSIGVSGETNGDSAVREDSAEKSNQESKVHISAHERDREEQASKRVQEASRYNNRDSQRSGRGGRGGRGGFRSRNKFDPSKQEKSDDPVAIRKQVEFYFSESNLLTDKFLFERVEGHKNVPVPIDVIHSFKRMQHFQPREAVINALKESTLLDIVDDDTAIQRKDPLPEGLTGKSMDEVQKVHEDRSMAKSVYVKGFGDEVSTTQFDIEAWFSNYGLTNGVRLRRDAQKGFKGSVFVEFDTEETQQNFLSLEPPPKWKGKDLEIKSKKQYCDEKVEDINNGRIRKNSPNPRYEDRKEKRPRRGSPSYDNKRHDYVEGDDARDWRERRNEEAGNGYKDSKHKGYGSSGRKDRGGHRGGRGGRDRNQEMEGRNRDEEKKDPIDVRTETSPLASQDDVNTEVTADPSNDTTITEDAASKKRAREDDGADESQGAAKKVDVKEGIEQLP